MAASTLCTSLTASLRWASRRVGMTAAHEAELGTVLSLAWPVMTTFVLNFVLILVNTLVVGHTGADNLAAAALGNMFANAAGNSILFGTASACDTLQSQAYGARNYARVGHISQRGLVIMMAMTLPISALLWNADAVLGRMGQDARTVEMSTLYVRLLIPGLPGAMCYEILKKHLQNIGVVVPTMVIQVGAIGLNGMLAYGLVYHTRLGFLGAPLAMAITNWFMLLTMLLFFRFHRVIHAVVRSWGVGTALKRAGTATAAMWARRRASNAQLSANPLQRTATIAPVKADDDAMRKDEGALVDDVTEVDDSALDAGPAGGSSATMERANGKAASDVPVTVAGMQEEEGIADVDDRIDATWVAISPPAAFSGWFEFLSLGLPSAVMLMCEWGSYEAVSIFAGMISTITLASHTVIAMTAGLSFMPALGMSVAASVRMGQQMGERKAAAAAFTYRIVVGATLAYTIINALFILCVHTVWARVFTDDDEVEALISKWLWLLSAYTLFDALQCVCCGALRGLGRPSLAACGNIVAYLVCGLPLCYAFGMYAGMGLPGLWLGFCIAVTVAFVVLNVALLCINWEKEAEKAYARATADVIAKQQSASTPAVAVVTDSEPVAAVDTAGDSSVAFHAEIAALAAPLHNSGAMQQGSTVADQSAGVQTWV